MNKPLVVLADLDPAYIIPLEDKITTELSDQFDIEIITEEEYFNTFFSSPQKIDNLIVSQELYSSTLTRHNVTNTFILTEEPVDGNATTTDNVTRIFKYSSTKEIFNHILYRNRDAFSGISAAQETQLLIVSSAIGGAGKTTVAMALSASLVKNHKRVLFIGTDPFQNFTYFLENRATLPNNIYRFVSGDADSIYQNLKAYIRFERFGYLPPFARNIYSMGYNFDVYNGIISAIKASRDFDYIVVDADMQLDEQKAQLLKNADKVVLIVQQDKMSAIKTASLLENIDCNDSEKFLFVCNKFRRELPNEYTDASGNQQFIVAEYIDSFPDNTAVSLDDISDIQGIRNLAYIFS